MTNLVENPLVAELLLRVLRDQKGEDGIPMVELEAHLRDEDLLAYCEQRNLIVFARPNYITYGGQVHPEPGWNIARPNKPGYKSIRAYLREEAYNCDHPEILVHLQLAERGKAEANRLTFQGKFKSDKDRSANQNGGSDAGVVSDSALEPQSTAQIQIAPQALSQSIAPPVNDFPTSKRRKRSTVKGEGRDKLIAALTKHHKYADGGGLNLEPIGNNELARLAEVRNSTASAFFSKEFKGHAKYRTLCADQHRLVAALKTLNGEFRPHDFYDARTPNDIELEREIDE